MKHLFPISATALLLSLSGSTAFAAPKKVDTTVLSDDWYTITLGAGANGKPYGYYNDHVEIKKGRLFYQNHVWKREEDYINEEQLGAFAENSPELIPLFFNFHSTYRTSETSIDGTVVDGKLLTVRAKQGGSELPIVKKALTSKTFFSIFFPYWLKQHLAELKPGKTLSFRTILEDNIEQGFNTVYGSVKQEKPDAFAEKSGTKKFLVDYRSLRSFWWLDAEGTCLRMEMPQQKMLVQKVNKAQAQAFLNGAQPTTPEE